MNPPRLQAQLEAVWRPRPGWLGQLALVNHTNVGRRFLGTSLAFFLIGGLLAMLLRTQLAFPGNDFLDRDTYNQLFTLHGTTMMFLFAVPAVEGLGVYLLPKMLGTRDLPYPRLSAYGYWCYLFGGILLYCSLLFGGAPDGGWFMYPPLTGATYSPGMGADFWLLGITFVEVSAVAAAVELVVAILKTRAPGMTLRRMPVFAWAMLVVSFMILFGFPPLILASILLELERAFGLPFYDVTRGGDPLLWQHLFWLFGHPEVYIIFLPAAGVLSTLIPVFAGRPLASYTWIVIALIATGFLSFGLWVHHMYTVGIPQLAMSFFSAASMAVAVPTGIQVFTWIATLWPSRPRMSVPMLYVYGFFFIFVIGGLTGVMVALVPFDWQVHDSHFVVAHLHYVLIGGMVFPLFAAIYYWLPHVCGRLPSERLGRAGFWLMFIGFNLTFLIMHLTGLLGMPRRVYDYAAGLGWEWTNLVSSVGGFVLAIGTAAFVVDVLLHLRRGVPASHNPWGADTLEWAMPSPPPSYNFVSLPRVSSRVPLWAQPELADEQQAARHYLGHHLPKRRELLATGSVEAEPEQVVVVPGNTLSPLFMAISTGLAVIGVLAGWYWLTGVAAAAVAVGACLWARWPGDDLPPEQEVLPGVFLPHHPYARERPGYWGLLATLLADGTVAASLLFGYFFYWTVTPDWPPPSVPLPALGAGLLLAGLHALSSVVVLALARWPRQALLLAALIQLAAVPLAWAVFTESGLTPSRHAYDATVFAMLGWALLHVLLSVLAAAIALSRGRPPLPSEWRVTTLFWHYGVLQALAFLLPLLLFPRVL